jgi:UDP-N-acetylglucosamine--N-acetylmuramyl-(pentapeptide) pyrophosphoryl-undecaprenol N-acetylglucosamine transferase
VPLPTAAADHQTHNARVLAEAGAAFLLAQNELTPVKLGELIDRLLDDRETNSAMAARALSRGRPAAADEIVSNFSTLLR